MIPLFVILIPFAIFLLMWLIMVLFNLYHVFRYGFGDITLFVGTFIFICISVLILFYAAQFLLPVDWQEPLFNFGNLLPSIPGLNSF